MDLNALKSNKNDQYQYIDKFEYLVTKRYEDRLFKFIANLYKFVIDSEFKVNFKLTNMFDLTSKLLSYQSKKNLCFSKNSKLTSDYSNNLKENDFYSFRQGRGFDPFMASESSTGD